MASTIKLKNGSGAPTTGDLVQGEPALDLTNKRLYTENASGVVIEVGTNPSTIDINAGTIDGTVIGGTTAAAGTFTTGQFNTSLNVDGTTNLDVVDIDGAVDMASTLTVDGTTNDGTTLAQIVQSGTGRAFSVNRNVASATRAVVNLAQLQASGGAEAVLDIQQTTAASRAIKVTPDGSIDRFSVYGTGALVTTPVAGGHAVFNEGGADSDFRVESATTANALFVEGSSGNVGIGTSSPSRKVSLADSVNGYNLELQQTSAYNSGNQSGIVFSAPYNIGGSVTDLASIRGGKENATDEDFGGKLAFYTRANGGSDTERMRIDSAGNVGIGANSPTTSLTLGTGTTGVSFQSGSLALNSGKIAVIKPIEVGTGNGHLVFETYEGGSGGGERMRIDSSGNVGIGDSSPSVKLDVYQSTVGIGAVDFRHVNGNRILINPSYNYHDAYNHIFRGLNGTDTHMTIDDSGNVGIGESNPASPLDIHVATDINMEVDSNASVLRISAVNDARSTNPAMSFQALSYDFRGAGGIGTRAVIDSSGNVGIGTE
jgi:hypothetical protein